MGASTSELLSPLAWVAIACAGLSVSLLVGFLIKKPPLVHSTKIGLFFGIAVFPIGVAITGNIEGYSRTQARSFCGSCHVMAPYTEDSANAASTSLASTHARNSWFGEKNCYTCHSDYGMYGTVTTKLSGLRHVYEYYVNYSSMPLEESLERIRLYKSPTNDACTHCHSTELEVWRGKPDHRGLEGDLETNVVLCASAGCHGPAHPFSKIARGEVVK